MRYFSRLSALRHSVWLFDYGYFIILNIDDCFLSAFGTVERKILQGGILPQHGPCFILTDRTEKPMPALRFFHGAAS